MAEIKCPKCGTTFKVDDSSYADILSQVRNQEFESELHSRLKDAAKQASADKDLALAKQESAQAAKLLRSKLSSSKPKPIKSLQSLRRLLQSKKSSSRLSLTCVLKLQKRSYAKSR
jgi:hypothetical protein